VRRAGHIALAFTGQHKLSSCVAEESLIGYVYLPRGAGEEKYAVDTKVTLNALALGLGIGIFILIRLRAEPVEDEEDQERLRSIEEGLGLRKLVKDRENSLDTLQRSLAGLVDGIGDCFGGQMQLCQMWNNDL
jgi:hypothetical protein